MILITNRKNHDFYDSGVTAVAPDEGKTYVEHVFKDAFLLDKEYYIGMDIESNGLDPYVNEALLLGLAGVESGITIDTYSVDPEYVMPKNYKDYRFIGHNVKFDYSFLKANNLMDMQKLWCTMLVDQKIYQGCGLYHNLGGKRQFNIIETVKTYLRYVPSHMNKDIRSEFIGVDPERFIFKPNHIDYLYKDIKYLIPIMEAQYRLAEKFNLLWYIKNIQNDLSWVIGDCENHGFVPNVEKWKANVKFNKDTAFKAEVELDETVRELRDKFFIVNDKKTDEYYYLTGGKFTNKRNKPVEINRIGLFGEPLNDKALFGVKKAKKPNAGNINWRSSTQIIDIFARLKLPLPTGDKFVPYYTPNHKIIKTGSAKGKKSPTLKVDTSRYSFTTNKDAINEMLIERPKSPAGPLLKKLIEFRKYDHYVTGFGENFLEKINPVTNRLHTLYRIESAKTGRFQSGGGKKRPDRFNSQNIPKEDVFRTCLGVEQGYSVTTCDLSGAEVTIMCDMAHDQQLYEWAVINDDAHSPIATKCWRHIYLYRAGIDAGIWDDFDSYEQLYSDLGIINLLKTHMHPNVKLNMMLYDTFEISKIVNKGLRTQFKAVTFGTVYGMYAGKCAKTLNISKDEGAVVIHTIKTAIPATFNMVESNVEFALNNGYLIINERTNSRILFPIIKRSLDRGDTLDFSTVSLVDGIARNARIQGTQADMIKESLVEIGGYNRQYNLDCHLLTNVHDEMAYKQPLNMDGKSKEWKNKPKHVIFSFDITVDKNTALSKLEKYKDQVDVVYEYGPTVKTKVSYPVFIALTMSQVADRYLNHYEMGAEFVVAPTWIK